MGSYIGKKPTDVPLTSSDINDNIILLTYKNIED